MAEGAETRAEAPKQTLVKLGFHEDFALSGLAAITSKTIAAPIERVKMVLQGSGELVKAKRIARRFNGMGECAMWIWKNEGPIGFWKSNLTNCIRYFPTQALNFALFPIFKNIEVLRVSKKDPLGISVMKNCVSGGLAGTTSLLFVYSLDFARTCLALDTKEVKKTGGKAERHFNGIWDVYKKTYAKAGIKGLYAGFVISAIGIFIYRGFYLGLYATIMPLIPIDGSSYIPASLPAPVIRFAVGYCVTVIAGLLSYPIDTIRRRMMVRSGGDASVVVYKGSLECARSIVEHDGVQAFYKGAGANILRGIAGAGVLAFFDSFVQLYVQLSYGPEYKAKLSFSSG